MYLPKATEIKNDPKVNYQRKKDHNREKSVLSDIGKIDAALEKNDEQELRALHRNLDGKYQSCIIGWGQSMYGFVQGYGFNYDMLGANSIRENLQLMRPKLESFMQGWNDTSTKTQASSSAYTPDVNVTVNNTVNISVSFDEARQKIEGMTALSCEQTDEILKRIDELEKISKEKSNKKSK